VGKETPVRRPRNPLGKATKDFVVVTKKGSHGWRYVYILDLGPPVEPGYVEPDQIAADLVGGVFLKRKEPSQKLITSIGAAAKGYGPLVYETAATLVGEELHPSSSQSEHARRLWGRYDEHGGMIFPLYPDEFKDKYGVSLRRMVEQGRELQLGPSDWEEMMEWVDAVATESWESSTEGYPDVYEPLRYQGSEKYQRAMARRNPRRRRR
jgi:hypothetical protein